MDIEKPTDAVFLRGIDRPLHVVQEGEVSYIKGFPNLRVVRIHDWIHLDLSHEQLQLLRDAALSATRVRHGICSNASFSEVLGRMETTTTPELKEFSRQFIELFGSSALEHAEASMSVHRWASEWEMIKLRNSKPTN
jgi:hypothetical protein